MTERIRVQPSLWTWTFWRRERNINRELEICQKAKSILLSHWFAPLIISFPSVNESLGPHKKCSMSTFRDSVYPLICACFTSPWDLQLLYHCFIPSLSLYDTLRKVLCLDCSSLTFCFIFKFGLSNFPGLCYSTS